LFSVPRGMRLTSRGFDGCHLGAAAGGVHMTGVMSWRIDAMRLILATGILIALAMPTEAAQTHRLRPAPRDVRAPQRATAPKGFAVPGWTAEQTQSWIDSASGPRD
jgi:hypothetical protein